MGISIGASSPPGDGSGGGGVYFPSPPISFSGTSLAACRASRDAAFGGGSPTQDIAPFQADQYLAIILRPQGAATTIETYLPGEAGNTYDNTKWVDRGSSQVTDAHIDSRIAAPARANNPSGTFADARIPAIIARDTEITAAVANLKGGVDAAHDTLKEIADKLVSGVAVSNGNIVITHEDGTTTQADATGLRKTDAQVNALIHAALEAAVEGNTETGIDVTYDSATNTFDFSVTAMGGGTGGVSLAQALAAILAGDGINIDRSTANQITISATGGGEPPEQPGTTFNVSYGLADANGNIHGADADQLSAQGVRSTFDLQFPDNTAGAPRWYFTLPAGRTVSELRNTALGAGVNDLSNWTNVSNTTRWYYSGPLFDAGTGYRIQVDTATS